MLADDRFDQVQARLALAQRDHHIAGAGDDEVAARAIELDAFRRRDGLGLPDRIAEAVDQLHALDRLVLRMVGEHGRLADRVIRRQLRLFFRDRAARLAGKQLAPGQARLLPPAIPQKAQGVGQALALVIALDLDAVQIALLFQEFHRLGHAVDDDVGARIRFQVHAPHVAARHFQAHARFIKTAVAGVRQQKEGLALEGAVVARFALLRGGAANEDQGQQAGKEQLHDKNRLHDKNASRNTPAKFGLLTTGCHRVSFQLVSSLISTVRRPLSSGVTVPVW